MGHIFIGTSGFNYNHWKETFYPKGLGPRKWLALYAERYDTVEINATFYRYFAQSVFARWRDQTPDSFRFTLKGPRVITHVKRLHEVDDDLKRFLESIQDLRAKLSFLLWQFPPTFKYDTDDSYNKLTQFILSLPQNIKHVFEFRHKSWFNDDVYTLLNRHNIGFVINDSSRWAAAEVITGDTAYIRFHGPAQLYASPYDTSALSIWANKIGIWLKQYDVYAYFNNDFGGHAIHNSVELTDLVHDRRQAN